MWNLIRLGFILIKFNYSKELLTLKHRIKKQQKISSRKSKDSNNYNVMRTKLQNSYLKLNNIKDDFLHKLTNAAFNLRNLGIEKFLGLA